MTRFFNIIFFLFTVLPFACASVISEETKNKAGNSLSLRQVLQNPGDYKGQTVVWGGEIIKNEAQKDGSMLLEVYERPLGVRDAPQINSASEGRFVVRSEKFLDPYVYKSGRKITVGGIIEGEEIRPLGQIEYRYPLVKSSEIYLWNESYYNPVPDPFVRFSFFYWPYYRYHRHHRHHHH